MQANITGNGTGSELLPTTGNDAAQILTNDHTVIKSLLRSLTQATETSSRRSTLERLKGVLTIHNAVEENLVYPALALVAKKGHESSKLYHETAEADKLVFELDTMLKTGDESKFAAKAQELEAAILEHIEDEEGKAFPHLEKSAEPQQAEMLTESVRELRRSLDYKPPSRAI